MSRFLVCHGEIRLECVSGSQEALFGYRVEKTHRMPDLHTSFSAKEPYN